MRMGDSDLQIVISDSNVVGQLSGKRLKFVPFFAKNYAADPTSVTNKFVSMDDLVPVSLLFEAAGYNLTVFASGMWNTLHTRVSFDMSIVLSTSGSVPVERAVVTVQVLNGQQWDQIGEYTFYPGTIPGGGSYSNSGVITINQTYDQSKQYRISCALYPTSLSYTNIPEEIEDEVSPE